MDSGPTLTPAFSYSDLVSRAESGLWPGFLREGRLTQEARSFLQQMHDDAVGDDLEGVSTDDMVGLAHSMWTWSAQRSGHERVQRLLPGVGHGGHPLGRDIVDIVGPDSPFLVDSVMGEIAEQGIGVRAMFHPIVRVQRDASGARGTNGTELDESYIQVHLDPVPEHKRQALLDGLRETLDDVRIAVSEREAIRMRMLKCADEVAALQGRDDEERADIAESAEFLHWLCDQNFVFLGVRDYEFVKTSDGSLAQEEPAIIPGSGLGLLRDEHRFVLRRGWEPTILTPQIRAFLGLPTPIIVAKANLKSRVHRRVRADYIGVKRYDSRREVVGEIRFIGLFTSEAYNRSVSKVPLLRRKVQQVIARAERRPGSRDDRRLQHILETFPRDEIFQTDAEDLLRTSLGILHLMDRPRAKLFLRRDQFDRFVSALVFFPRDRFSTDVRRQAGEVLRDAFAGRISAVYPSYGDGPLARVHYIIGTDPGHPEPNPRQLENDIARLARTWHDAFDAEARRAGSSTELVHRYEDAFTAGYRENNDATQALADILELERLTADEPVRVRAYRNEDDGPETLRCKAYSSAGKIELSRCLPILETMGLYVIEEAGQPVQPTDAEGVPGAEMFLHDFSMRSADGRPIAFDAVENEFEQAFAAAWSGRTENDGFNRLILKLGVSWREAALMRALARYRQQSGLDPSQGIQEEALSHHSDITRLILDLFRARFEPGPTSVDERREKQTELEQRIEGCLQRVASLDYDRVLRRLAALVAAIQRTNYYQLDEYGAPKSYLSFKIASRTLEDLPLPKPYREIFVWAPHVEGVHLRFGPVARGGLRWSDRRDDYRTEVLGLVKAQQVKNAVIVPVGAKGGFYPKQLPAGTDRRAQQVEAIRAYKTFLAGLLDLTDNLVGGEVVPPEALVRWDNEDPYLVVAADKGTATFSDIANSVAIQRGFWLHDAFASGGSAGYDHKKMGITARGAWEAVKRHFREMGKDIQATPFTVAGVGDMSGDVFGNAMLLSRHICLVAAFDHRDIFIDPEPDPTVSWQERMRLFELQGSSWNDYDAAKLSPGGGVYSRRAKSIKLEPAARQLLGLPDRALDPNEIIRAILKAPVELLYFGGIGTYVKAAAETQSQVGDKANDLLRVDAEDLRAKVVGEGANLALTQAGRIVFARRGGRINTDAVDNSAGVDTSDHEVNIKILLNAAMSTDALRPADREPLLAAMTEEVAAHVLQHNYDQTLCLTMCEACAAEDLDAHERLMEKLEAAGKLDRTVEGLPTMGHVRTLHDQRQGLTRPETAVLVAYAKIDLFDGLTKSAVPDDPHFERMLEGYFPKELGRFRPQMQSHRLRREIISTVLANDIVNFGGPVFIHRVREISESDGPSIARAFQVARCVFEIDELSARVHELDHDSTRAQTELLREMVWFMRRQAFRLARKARSEKATPSIDATIAAYQPGVQALVDLGPDQASGAEAERLARAQSGYQDLGAPADLAADVASLRLLLPAFDIVDLAQRVQLPVVAVGLVFHAIGDRLGFDNLRAAARDLVSTEHWDRLAVRRMTEEFYAHQLTATEIALTGAAAPPEVKSDLGAWANDAMTGLITRCESQAKHAQHALEQLERTGPWSFAKLTIAAAQINELLASMR
ncbi:MAG: NAD-glutamate dehydrogenase [Planctomycetota bacterium]